MATPTGTPMATPTVTPRAVAAAAAVTTITTTIMGRLGVTILTHTTLSLSTRQRVLRRLIRPALEPPWGRRVHTGTGRDTLRLISVTGRTGKHVDLIQTNREMHIVLSFPLG